MMRRGAIPWALAVGVVTAPVLVAAQPAARAPVIGLLVPGSSSSFEHRVEAFRRGLRDLGYFERQNVTIEPRFAEGRAERFPDLAAELVRLKVTMIVTMGTPAALAAKRATRTIPIVMANVGDAVGLGLVASLPRPGGNITGSSYLLPELVAKRLEVLKELLPELDRVTVLVNPGNPVHRPQLKGIEAAAHSLGIQPQIVEVREPDELAGAFSAMTKKGAHALAVLDDGMFVHHRTRIADLALRSRLPTIYGLREEVEAGGLVAYGPNQFDLAYRAATFVDKILKGAKPADLPVEQPTKFEFVINMKKSAA